MTTVTWAMDLLVVASVITATRFIAPHAASDPAMHAAGSALLGFASVIDGGEGYPESVGFLALGVAAWRGQWCPKWLAVIGVVIGAVTLPPWPPFAYMYLYYLTNILTVVWVAGMSILTGLWSAAHYRVPATFVILRNDEYGVLKWFAGALKATGLPGLDLPGIDYCAIAQGYGVQAVRIASRDDLAAALVRSVAADSPSLIEVPIRAVG